MRPDLTTPRVVALFKEKWSAGFFPKRMILKEVEKSGPPVSERSLEYALAKAVGQGDLKVVRSHDRGALYSLASHYDASAMIVKSLERAPLRSLQWQDPIANARAVRRWQDRIARKGGHDLRPGHKCIACGYVPHFDPFAVRWPPWFRYDLPRATPKS